MFLPAPFRCLPLALALILASVPAHANSEDAILQRELRARYASLPRCRLFPEGTPVISYRMNLVVVRDENGSIRRALLEEAEDPAEPTFRALAVARASAVPDFYELRFNTKEVQASGSLGSIIERRGHRYRQAFVVYQYTDGYGKTKKETLLSLCDEPANTAVSSAQ